MNTAMHIMAIQHQLVLAISEKSDLKEMLQQFLFVCGARLDSSNSHIFLSHDTNNNPTYQLNKHGEMNVSHYLSTPKQKHGAPWSKNQQLAILVNEFKQSNLNRQILEFESNVYHFFQIGDFGVLTIDRKKRLGKTIQNALTPVLQKLTTSCISSMVHQALVYEIKNRKQIEDKIRYQASHDFLTGLCNRVEMQNRLSEALIRSKERHLTGALLLIDLVHFKNINDVLGHHVGDKVLRQVAHRLKNMVTAPHTVARFGGAEFIIVLSDLPSDQHKVKSIIDTVIKRLIVIMETPFEVQEGIFSLSCFIGYETFNNGNKSIYDIIKNADIAMHEAIKRGGSRSVVYDIEMSNKLTQRISYKKEIKAALDNNEFELHYQPQFDHLNNMIGAEALLRWNHPLRGYESPALYIPIAEESDLIVRIGDFVLKQACADIQRLERMYLPESFKQISVNASAKQLARTDFVGTVIRPIEETNIPPSRLKIEITESIMMGDIELSIGYLEELRKYGVQCAIDDFGTGYSSLAYLKRLPASLLKIDRVFVTDIHKDEGNKAIANMIIGLAKRLKMEVIAEGVENQQELDCLIELGCFQYQGYYFGRPVPFSELALAINKKP